MMDIVFLGTTAIHHALIAANLYLGRLDNHHFNNTPGYCVLDPSSGGLPIYIGDDEKGNRVYTLGGGSDLMMAQKTINHLVVVLDCSPGDLIVRPVSIKGDKLLLLLEKLPRSLGGAYINLLAADILLEKQLDSIRNNINELKKEIALN